MASAMPLVIASGPAMMSTSVKLAESSSSANAVDARDHQRFAGMDEIEDGLEFRTSREGGAVAGLGADHGAACGLTCPRTASRNRRDGRRFAPDPSARPATPSRRGSPRQQQLSQVSADL